MAFFVVLAIWLYIMYLGFSSNSVGGMDVSRNLIVLGVGIFVLFVINRLIKASNVHRQKKKKAEMDRIEAYMGNESPLAESRDRGEDTSRFLTNEEILNEALEKAAMEEEARKANSLFANPGKVVDYGIKKTGSLLRRILKIVLILAAWFGLFFLLQIVFLRMAVPGSAADVSVSDVARLAKSLASFFEQYLGEAVFAAMVVAVICWRSRRRNKPDINAVTEVFYSRLVPREIEKVFGSVTYNRYGRLPLSDVEGLNCFKKFYIEKGDQDESDTYYYLNAVHQQTGAGHQISGTYRGMPFSASYERLEGLYRTRPPKTGVSCSQRRDGDTGDWKEPYNSQYDRCNCIFEGVMVCVPMRRTSVDRLGLLSLTGSELKNAVGTKDRLLHTEIEKNEMIFTESEEFNRLFRIYGVDEENALFILTPDMMERLAAVFNSICIKNELAAQRDQRVAVSFYRDVMYLGVMIGAPFSFREKTADAETIKKLEQRAAADAEMIRRIVECAYRIVGGMQ